MVGTPASRSERLDAYQQKHGYLGFVVAVVYKAFDDRAPYMASLVTYYAFVSLFPLLLLFVSIMGFVLQSDPSLRQTIENSAVSDLPGIGNILRQNIQGFKGSGVGIALGLLGLLYGGMGAMQSSQYAFNTFYGVPRRQQPNPFRSRTRSFGVLLILGTTIVISTGINLAISDANSVSSQLGVGFTVAGYLADLAINIVLFSAAFRVLTVVDLKWFEVVPGGILSAAVWELFQTFGSRYVVHEARHGDALYGIFGVVLATVAWIYLVALIVMLSAEINVVWRRRLWPRSLKAPFTEDMEPTPADLAAYRSYAEVPQFKYWQRIDVHFDPPEPSPQPPDRTESPPPSDPPARSDPPPPSDSPAPPALPSRDRDGPVTPPV
jgi:YihY family inner membrane protein